MRTAHILMHVAVEGPGRLRGLLEVRGFALREYRLFAGVAVPQQVASDDLVLVMGGPMGVADRDDPRYPFLNPEIALLRWCLANAVAVLGICLGSQLLAHAAGAAVYANRRPCTGGGTEAVREVGWAPVQFQHAPDRPELAGLQRWEWLLHWHGDTFDLPDGAVLLASTPMTPHQAFRLPRAIGLQFHPEVDVAIIDTWLVADQAYAESAAGLDALPHIRAETARLLPAAHAAADLFLGNCLNVLLG